MRPIIEEVPWNHGPQGLGARLARLPGTVVLESARLLSHRARYSLVTTDPFLTFRSTGTRCEVGSLEGSQTQYGNPWRLLDSLQARCELLDEIDFPFPLGGCFGFWGYDLKNFVEPRLTRKTLNDLELPDCSVGFHDSLVVFDHELHQAWLVSTGLRPDGSREESRALARRQQWLGWIASAGQAEGPGTPAEASKAPAPRPAEWRSTTSRAGFVEGVRRAQELIRAGDIYQVNLSHRLTVDARIDAWALYQQLTAVSPAPFAAFLNAGDFALCSSSPELFLRLSGAGILTRPIKGTRPRSTDPTRDAQLSFELQTSPKEMSELVMITDLLRNDLGRVCEYGSVQVPELMQLERYAQVQHLVSTVEGRLRPGTTHLEAFASCFPGGSITGAPKIRAMEIIEELEPVTRGPYTGAIGYLGFNRESQLSILIRTAICQPERTHFQVGAGIVADSDPEAEYEETLAKAGGFLAALGTRDLQAGDPLAVKGLKESPSSE
ncbi:MAG TPA: aminodeoxychorismate synthase component I [Verrucomicrobiales bacterium]|nr:aminodeoxychorismate synthase component I [Verrucomicrobiales bacterium]